MTALYQRLKELSKNDFESMIDQILQRRFPTANVIRVNGAGGDRGLDSFIGRVNGNVAIWQDKHFPNGIGKVQRKQILESIEGAFAHHKVEQWTLCVPIDLNPVELEWFQSKVQDAYSSRCDVNLLQASQIVTHLLNFRQVRDAFFPNVVPDTTKLHGLLLGTDKLADHEIADLGRRYIEQYVTKLEQADPRLRYEVVTGGVEMKSKVKEPGLLASVFDGTSRIDVFARDIAALRDDPIRVMISLSRKAGEKAQEMLRTGRGASFRADEIVSVQMPRAFQAIFPGADTIDSFVLTQDNADRQPFAVSLEAKLNGDTVRYPLVNLKIDAQGEERLCFLADAKFPLDFRLDISIAAKSNDCEVEIGGSFHRGTTFSQAAKALRFAKALSNGSDLKITNVETEKLFIQIQRMSENTLDDVPEGLSALVEHGELASKYLGAELLYPESPPSEKDYLLLETIKFLSTGEDFQVNTLDFKFTKDSSNCNQLGELISSGEGTSLLFKAGPEQQVRSLFGQPINTGPMILLVDRLKLEDASRTKKRYDEAAEGSTVEIRVIGPSQARYITPEEFSRLTKQAAKVSLTS